MATPSEKDREVAREIVGIFCGCNPQVKKHGYKCVECTMRNNIAQALALAREEGRAEAVVKLGKWEEARQQTVSQSPLGKRVNGKRAKGGRQ